MKSGFSAAAMLFAAVSSAFAQSDSSAPAAFDIRTIDPDSFRAIAFKIPDGESPKIDGRLNEAVWERAPVQGNFIQREPQYGQPSKEKTEFRVLYDDKTLYFGIWVWDSHPAEPAPIQDGDRRIDVGFELVPHSLSRQRGIVLGAVPARVGPQRVCARVERGCPREPSEPQLTAAHRVRALRAADDLARLPVTVRGPGARPVWRRLQAGPHQRSHWRLHLPHGLRASRSRPGGREPDALQPLLPREAAILHRERGHLRLRQGELEPWR